MMAGTTGLEPATSAVTGQRSNQLSYVPKDSFNTLVIYHIESELSLCSTIAVADSISGLLDTRTATAATGLSLTDEIRILVSAASHRPKLLISVVPVFPAGYGVGRRTCSSLRLPVFAGAVCYLISAIVLGPIERIIRGLYQ